MTITPFIIDGVTFQSYANVAESLVTNLADVSRRDTWRALDDTLKEEFLASATAYIDAHLVFLGHRSDPAQPLEWPRDGVIVFGVQQADNLFPPQLAEATALFAATLAKDPTHASNPTDLETAIVRNRTVDGDSISYETGSHVTVHDTRIFRDDQVLNILAPFLAEEPEHLHPINPGSGIATPLPAGSGVQSFGLGGDRPLYGGITDETGQRTLPF